MKVCILGIDGQLGWALALYLSDKGYEVFGIDNFARRGWVKKIGSDSVIPIADQFNRSEAYKDRYGKELNFIRGDILNYTPLVFRLKFEQPDVIVHFAEQPSAPYSMVNRKHCNYTMQNNIKGTLNVLWAMKKYLPNCHLVKISSMGIYGLPNIPISEGDIEIEFMGHKDVLPFPCKPRSFYHQSKLHDTNNIRFACDMWGLKSTDICQGVVFGTVIHDDERLNGRFDVDEHFGTAINRFMAQALIESDITMYGSGKQVRGFLPIQDSMQCIELIIANPPKYGEYRLINQFAEIYSINNLASIVRDKANEMGLNPKIINTENVRNEKTEHFYEPVHEKLLDMGYEPTTDLVSEVSRNMEALYKYRDRINKDILYPKTRFK